MTTQFHVSRRRSGMTILAVVGLLAAVNVLIKSGPAHTGLVLGPVVALGLVTLARRAGLSWDDLGLARPSWRKGARYGGIAVVLVAAVYLIGAALPLTRSAFLDARYHLHPGPALVTALIVIPLSTVLLEEVAFRGVLLALLHHRGAAWARGISSALFGLWHVLPSLRLVETNHAAGTVFGHGAMARFLVVAATVVFTGLAGFVFCELRRRSGSLLASAGLHWATNGLGVLLAATLWVLQPA